MLLKLWNMFTLRVDNFNLRNFQESATEEKETVKYSLEIVRYRCPQFWTLMADTIKNSFSLIEFKSKIKLRKSAEYSCRLCKTYFQILGFARKISCHCINGVSFIFSVCKFINFIVQFCFIMLLTFIYSRSKLVRVLCKYRLKRR